MCRECSGLKIPFVYSCVTNKRCTPSSHTISFLKFSLCLKNTCTLTYRYFYEFTIFVDCDLRLDCIVKTSYDCTVNSYYCCKVNVHLNCCAIFCSGRTVVFTVDTKTKCNFTGYCEFCGLFVVASCNNCISEVFDRDCATCCKKIIFVSDYITIFHCLKAHICNFFSCFTNYPKFKCFCLFEPFFNCFVTDKRVTESSHVIVEAKFLLCQQACQCNFFIVKICCELVLDCIDTTSNDFAINIKNYCSNSCIVLCVCGFTKYYAQTECVCIFNGIGINRRC